MCENHLDGLYNGGNVGVDLGYGRLNPLFMFVFSAWGEGGFREEYWCIYITFVRKMWWGLTRRLGGYSSVEIEDNCTICRKCQAVGRIHF